MVFLNLLDPASAGAGARLESSAEAVLSWLLSVSTEQRGGSGPFDFSATVNGEDGEHHPVVKIDHKLITVAKLPPRCTPTGSRNGATTWTWLGKATIVETAALSACGHDRIATVSVTVGLTRVGGDGASKVRASTKGAGDDDEGSSDCVPLVRMWFAEHFGGDGAIEGAASAERLFRDRSDVLGWLRGLAAA